MRKKAGCREKEANPRCTWRGSHQLLFLGRAELEFNPGKVKNRSTELVLSSQQKRYLCDNVCTFSPSQSEA